MFKETLTPTKARACALLLAFAVAAPAWGQGAPTPAPAPAPGETGTEKTAAQELPKAEEVLDRHIEVSGGKAAYEKLTSMVMHGEMMAPGMPSKMTMIMISEAPDRSVEIVEMPGMMKQTQCCVGDVAWEISSMTGPRLLQGKELEEAKQKAKFDAEYNWREHYTQYETKGIEDVGGKPLYKVEMTKKTGKKEMRHFDKETGLLVRITSKEITNMGEMPMEINFADYREVAGIKMPHAMVMRTMGQEMKMTMTKIEPNGTVPADQFAVPAEIQALIDKSKKSPAPPPAPGGTGSETPPAPPGGAK